MSVLDFINNYIVKLKTYKGLQNPFPFKLLEDGTAIYNLSIKDEYYTQRNNKYFPISSCNTTALTNSIIASNISIAVQNGLQPEDIFTKKLETKEAYETAMKLTPWFVEKGKLKTEPRLIGVMLAWVAHEIIGKKICVFTSRGNLQDLIYNMVVEKGAGIALGSFTPQGHYVSLVGFKTAQTDINHIETPADVESDKIECLIIDDPWGDFRTNYKVHDGNDIKLSIERFNNLVWGDPGKKYLHYIRARGFNVDGYKINNYETVLK